MLNRSHGAIPYQTAYREYAESFDTCRIALSVFCLGKQEDDGCDYIIAVQHGGDLKDLQPLPELARNARYVHHANECLDIGTVGWVLDNHVPNPKCAGCSAW